MHLDLLVRIEARIMLQENNLHISALQSLFVAALDYVLVPEEVARFGSPRMLGLSPFRMPVLQYPRKSKQGYQGG